MLVLNKNILTIGGNRLEGGPLTPPTPPGPSDEVTIGTQTWKTTYLDIDDGQGGVKNCYGGDLKFYTYDAATRICTANYPGWHVAVETDYNVLISNTLDNTDTSTFSDLFDTEYGGTDKFGLNLRPMCLYLYNNDDMVISQGNTILGFGPLNSDSCVFTSRGKDGNKCYGLSYVSSAFVMQAYSKSIWYKYGTWTDVYTIIRLVKDT